MKNLVAVAALMAVMAPSAYAADLPARLDAPAFRPPAAAPLPIPPTFTWSGVYAGLNVGAAFNSNASYTLLDNGDPVSAAVIAAGERPNFIKRGSDGIIAGAQVGYNYEIGGMSMPSFGGVFGGGGGVVVGVEADAFYTDIHNGVNYAGPFGNVSDLHSATDFVGTVRGRLGYAFDNVMVYGTGGFAYGNVRGGANFYGPDGARTFGGFSEGLKPGYAYGGGVEYAIPTSSFLNFVGSSAVTVKAEYLHYDLGSRGTYVASTFDPGRSYQLRTKNDGDIVRAGVNYKFNGLSSLNPVGAISSLTPRF